MVAVEQERSTIGEDRVGQALGLERGVSEVRVELRAPRRLEEEARARPGPRPGLQKRPGFLMSCGRLTGRRRGLSKSAARGRRVR